MQQPDLTAEHHHIDTRSAALGLLSIALVAVAVIRFSSTVYNVGQLFGLVWVSITLH